MVCLTNLTMERVLEECKIASESDASFTWASEEFLLQEKVALLERDATLATGRSRAAFERLYVHQL